MNKILVSYFSASGVTKRVATRLAETIKGDLFEIKPEKPYSNTDLNWNDQNSRSTKEMNDKIFRPKIIDKVSNIAEYDIVLIGFPVWWYTAPRIINTFIEENNLDGKKVYVFVTSGGSSVDGSLNDLKRDYSTINFVSGKRLTGYEDNDEYIDWVK